MNRRKFLRISAALPFAARAGIAGSQSPAPEKAIKHAAGTTESARRPNFDRYRLTLNRVLERPQPAYTQELLQDLRGEPGRRFTNFSGDLSGRWVGALAASSASFGDQFPALDEFAKKALPLQHSEGYFGKSFSAERSGPSPFWDQIVPLGRIGP